MALPQVVDEGVKLIIVVARPGSCKAIAKKIGDVCREHEIALMDIRGKNLLERKRVTYDFTGVSGGTKEELYQKIARADVVSFDLFDTLVMREVLSSMDIAELTDALLREMGFDIYDFTALRLGTEKRLSKNTAPTLEKLYSDIKKSIPEVFLSPSELAGLEWETDYKTIVPRRSVCEIFDYCICQGKQVYIVTDTYYCLERIEAILEKCNISGYAGIYVSCEYGTGKRQRLFDRLREKEGDRKYLHIGDDEAADIEMASKAGMETFRVYSGEELLDAVGNMGMEPHMDSLAERLKIGMLVAKLFNDPFQFDAKKRKIELRNAYDIGYLLCAPIIADFVLWFREQVRAYEIPNIWFCSRDGYLLQKLYHILDDTKDSVYFMTSRMAAIRAGMMDEGDLSYVDSMKYSGTTEENLKRRFGLDAEYIEVVNEKASGLLRYKDGILKKAVYERENYKKYISTLKIEAGAIAFFDFVAKGTTQMYVQRLVEQSFKGLYFLQLEPEFMSDKGLEIEPFYGADEMETSRIYDNYYILETILTAPHPGICGFDNRGMPMFAEEIRTEKDIKCFSRAQEGIIDYFQRYLELLPESMRKQSKELDEVLLGLFANLEIQDDDFLSLVVEDSFFNRMTGIRELIR